MLSCGNGSREELSRDGFDHHKLSSLQLAEQLTILNPVYAQFLGSGYASNQTVDEMSDREAG